MRISFAGRDPRPRVWWARMGRQLFWGVLVAALAVASGWPLTVWQKVVTRLVMPYSLAWLAASWLTFQAWRRQQWALARLSCGIALLLFAGGNGWLAKELHWQLERRLVAANAWHGAPLDSVVLLGGGATAGPDGRAQLGVSGDRVLMAARLYHAGVTRRIICTGSRIEGLDRTGRDQAALAVELLRQVGIPPEALQQIGGRHTAEEMRLLSEMLPRAARWGLITSAFHMPRALRLARQQGFHPVPLPVDFRTPPDRRPTVLDVVPDAYDAYLISRHIKEWLAVLVGR